MYVTVARSIITITVTIVITTRVLIAVRCATIAASLYVQSAQLGVERAKLYCVGSASNRVCILEVLSHRRKRTIVVARADNATMKIVVKKTIETAVLMTRILWNPNLNIDLFNKFQS
jgi:hypothetical protein